MTMLALHRRALLTAFAASAVFGRFRAFAANVGAKISAVVNAVTAQPKEGTAEPTPVAEGQDLPPGTIIATGPKSGAELTYADGAVLVIGQRSTATLAIDDTADTLTKGAFRFRGASTANALLTTPLLRIEARSAEFVVAVAEGQTICGVVAGEITCTSIKKGTAAKVAFVKHFKEVQKLQTQLDQYTDLTAEQQAQIETILPEDELRSFRGQYLRKAEELRADRKQAGDLDATTKNEVEQLDFEFVLFASSTIDYDYIMKLIADYSAKAPGSKASMSREQLIGLIASDAKFMDEREDISDYVRGLKAGEGLDEAAIRTGYEKFKADKAAKEMAALSEKHGLPVAPLQAFVEAILARRIFDGEALTELLALLELGWKARAQKELALMGDLLPLLKKRAGGREIAGLKAYEDAR